MRIKAAACIALMLVALFVSACPKSNTMLEQSRKPGNVLPDTGVAGQQQETEYGTPPAGGSSGGGSTTPPAGDSGGDTGGDDDDSGE